MARNVFAIAAMDEDRVIGFQGKLPWHLPEDMRRFAELTRGHTVLMGRKTFDSLPERFKPLPGRKNVVASRSLKDGELSAMQVEECSNAVQYVSDWNAAKVMSSNDILWIIGGASVYSETMPFWDEVYLTKVRGKHMGDVFFPEFEDGFSLLSEERGEGFLFLRYKRTRRP